MNPFVRDYGGDIDWNIGSLFCHEMPVFKLLHTCEEYNIPHPIRYAFGSIPSLMAGGRIPPLHISEEDAEGIAKQYLDRGIACRLTLSNPHITEEDIKNDTINAKLMNFLNSESSGDRKNGVIVVSDLLAKYVKDKYQNLEVILSIIRPAYDTGYGPDKDTFDYYSNFLNDSLYDVVVVNSAKIDIPDFMETLPHKEKVELIAFHACVRNCPRAKEHYESSLQLGLANFLGKNTEDLRYRCDRNTAACFAEKRRRPFDYASYTEREIKKLVSLGYKHFKLADRLMPDEAFYSGMVEYIFKSEPMRYLMHVIY